jgi:hypothetical protein
MAHSTKSTHLQIRVSGAEKAELRRRARQSGLDMSTYVLQRVFPPAEARFQEAARELAKSEDPSYPLAEIHSLLANLGTSELKSAIGAAPAAALDEFSGNYLAALVESACGQRNIPVPGWTKSIAPLRQPYFATDTISLRQYLLTHAPAAFRRRNLFVDSDVGSRV